MQPPPPLPTPPSKPIHPFTISILLFSSLLSLLILSLSLSLSTPPHTHPNPHPPPFPNSFPSSPSLPSPPSFSYLLTGSSADSHRLFRLLLSLYHPRNTYLLHLDLIADQQEREGLARMVQGVPLFRSVGNVHVLGKADFAYQGGSSALSSILHGAAVLLRVGKDWDWFVNVHVNEYPLVTQDDLLHIFSFLPRDLNFVQHSSYIGWREARKLRPIIVDPGLYLSKKAEMFYVTQKRILPTAYRIFTGSSSVILSRKFIEHCIMGVDNLPRVLLMYYANTPSSHTSYFQTLLCNSPEFNHTIMNDHLHYIQPDTTPKLEPRELTLDDLNNMTQSGAAFATGFSKKDFSVLDHIDKEILNREPDNVVPGGWCLGGRHGDRCTVWGALDVLRPGPGATGLGKAIVRMLSDDSYRSNRCIWDQPK